MANKKLVCGISYTGKSTFSSMLQKERIRATDLDQEIFYWIGDIPKYINEHGEKAFRKIERKVLIALLKKDDLDVIFLGGGFLTSTASRELIKRRKLPIYFLHISYERFLHRATTDNLITRPLLKKTEEFYQQRTKKYKTLEYIDIDVDSDDYKHNYEVLKKALFGDEDYSD